MYLFFNFNINCLLHGLMFLACQTVLSFPFDLDLNQIACFKEFLNKNESLAVKLHKNIDSIRKNLFDFYNEDTDVSENEEKLVK